MNGGYYDTVESGQIDNIGFLQAFFLGERTDGLFVEVGAFDGIKFSNTWGLAERGWTGHMLEPISESAAACKRNHAHHPKVEVHEVAIGACEDWFNIHVGGFLSSVNADAIKQYHEQGWGALITGEVRLVHARSLDSFLESVSVPVGFDLLVVDVEGFESEVFEGFELGHWRPKMMVVELHDTCPTFRVTRQNDRAISQKIVQGGYEIVHKDHINTVFVANEIAAKSYQNTH